MNRGGGVSAFASGCQTRSRFFRDRRRLAEKTDTCQYFFNQASSAGGASFAFLLAIFLRQLFAKGSSINTQPFLNARKPPPRSIWLHLPFLTKYLQLICSTCDIVDLLELGEGCRDRLANFIDDQPLMLAVRSVFKRDGGLDQGRTNSEVVILSVDLDPAPDYRLAGVLWFGGGHHLTSMPAAGRRRCQILCPPWPR